MPLRLIFMGTPDFAVPTLLELAGQGHDIAAVYTRAAKPAGRRGLELVPSPVEREARKLGLAGADAGVAERRRRAGGVRRAQRRCRGRRGLRPDPAEADPRCAAARLLQPACLAAAALARRRADQPRDHGGRRRERRHGDEDGRGPRHRRHGDDRARADRRRHDRGRAARRAGAARRRPDGARARRAGARHACSSRRSRRTASPMRPRSTRPRRASTGASRGRRCTTTSAACRRFPAPGARWRGEPREGAAHDQGRGQRRARHGARRPPHHRLRRRRGAHRRIAEGRRPADAGGGVPARHAGSRRARR